MGLTLGACVSPTDTDPTTAGLVEHVVWDYSDSAQGPVYFNDRAAPKLAPGQVFARASCDVDADLALGISLIGRPGGLPVPTPLTLEASLPCGPSSGAASIPMVGRAVGGEDVLVIHWAIPGVDPRAVADDAVHYDIQIIQYGW